MGLPLTLPPLAPIWPYVVALLVLAAAAYALLQSVAIRLWGPRDTLGNGIVIGAAKAFDNRTLALRIERLSASLAALQILNKNVADNLGALQGQTSSDTTRMLTVGARALRQNPPAAPTKTSEAADASEPKSVAAHGKAAGETPETVPPLRLAAGDLLTDQLALASQIVNLETLYERSLTDRLLGNATRLQTVLGFSVSIEPPAGYQDCVAIAEIAVRMVGGGSVSLVAQIPQEKTYNAQSVSSSATSIGGSAVAQVVTLGVSSKGAVREVYVHRDSDTIAFERSPTSTEGLFDGQSATAFGWEFRPVLGRRAVAPGVRQMLAVIAVPETETTEPNDVTLEIRRRSYWRAYDRTRQTSRPKWGFLPWKIDRSRRDDFDITTVTVPNTAKVQGALAPKITNISWASCGADRAMVIVTGSNFFSGTKVAIGGRILQEEDGSLTLKSERALEFATPMSSLTSADAVLIGRFGASIPLVVSQQAPLTGLSLEWANVKPVGYAESSHVNIAIRGEGAELTIDALRRLPEPLMFIGPEAVPLPYDYSPGVISRSNGTAVHVVHVRAWVPSKILARNASISFRVPFCGFEFDSSFPISFTEPTLTRVGEVDGKTIFWIRFNYTPLNKIRVALDRSYDDASGDGPKEITLHDYRFEVATEVVERFEHMVVGAGDSEYYLLAIPRAATKEGAPFIDGSAKPPEVTQGSQGPIEWTGTGLDAIHTATVLSSAPADAPDATTGTTAEFVVSGSGSRIQVYFADGGTAATGKAEMQFQTRDGQTLQAPFFIVKNASAL